MSDQKVAPTPIVPPVYAVPEPTSDIANVVECEYMMYGTFREHFHGLDARRSYMGTMLYIPCANGQVVRVRVDVLSPEDAAKYRKGEAP